MRANLCSTKYFGRGLCRRAKVGRRNISRTPPLAEDFKNSLAEKALLSKVESKAFSKSLLLPQTAFPLWNTPSTREVPFRERTCDDLYRWQWTNAKGPLFVLHDGPPYANGHLHMGHALNKVLKDIINRYHVSRGYRVHYVPGWDCHGLPIENKTLKDLGKDSLSLPAHAIRSAAKATAEREIHSQREEFRQLGIMADWSAEGTYRTLDRSYEIRQLRIFQKMVEKGLIYRHYRPVHYSPSSRSALAEAELIYEDNHISHSVYVSFAIDSKAKMMSTMLREILAGEGHVHLLVWTTTPWTLTANMGIAVHPDLTYTVLRRTNEVSSGIIIVAKDRRPALAEIIGPAEEVAEIQGSELVDTTYIPLFSSVLGSTVSAAPLKIIPAAHVTSESGTGLVHCAPAHGAEDYNAFRALGMISSDTNIICHVDHAGKFTEEVTSVMGTAVGMSLVGQEVLKAGSKTIIDILEEAGNLVKIQRIKHRYPYDWKTHEPIIVTATSQWFANLDNIKDDALHVLQDVTFLPKISRNRLQAFVRSRSEWCISRQRVWGVPIPALHHIPTDRAFLNSVTLNHILPILEEKGMTYWWDGPIAEFVPPTLCEEDTSVSEVWRKGTDTMDVWFDSGTSWSMLKEMDIRGYAVSSTGENHIANICLEGSDQHRGWFQSQLLTAVGSASDVGKSVSPYGMLITHGMVLDQQGKKMSKSIGNIVSPMTILNGGQDKRKEPAYGADVLRLWAATVEYWNDMSIGPTVLAQTAESLRKIRNSARFILGNIGDEETRRDFKRVTREEMGLAERYVMHEVYKLEQVAFQGYESYNFPRVMNSLTNLANITLSSLYFDITKDCLYANDPRSLERRSVVTVLEQTLTTMTSVMAPVLPHLAEEIHATLQSGTGQSVFMKQWAPLSQEWNDSQAEQDMVDLLRIRSTSLSLLEQARREKHLKSSLEAEVDLIIPGTTLDISLVQLLRREEHFLKTLFIVSDVSLEYEGNLGTKSPEWAYTNSISIPGCDEGLGIRIRPATLSKCPRCWTYTRREADPLCGRCAAAINY